MLKTDLSHAGDEIYHTEYTWQSMDGVKLFGQSWQPGKSPKAVIVIAHGFGEHSGRYAETASYFVKKGYAVMAMDWRGHGRSDGKRGYAKGFRKFILDYEMLIQQASQSFPEKRIVLYGHSFGGNVVINYCISNIIHASGIIITSPWLKLSFSPNRVMFFLGSMIKYILPGIILKTGLVPEDISRDMRTVYLYKKDPLVHDKISLGLFFETVEFGAMASKSIYKINCPMLVMHGTEDNITSFKTTREFVMNASKSTTFKSWQGGYHELHNDLDKENVISYMTDWLNSLQSGSSVKSQ